MRVKCWENGLKVHFQRDKEWRIAVSGWINAAFCCFEFLLKLCISIKPHKHKKKDIFHFKAMDELEGYVKQGNNMIRHGLKIG